MQGVGRIIVGKHKALFLYFNPELPLFQHFFQRTAQKGYHDAPVVEGAGPGHIKKGGVFGELPFFQHIHQPRIVHIIGHVVGHNVLQPAHAGFLQLFMQSLQLFFGAQFGIDTVGIYHIIAVGAAGGGFKNRGGIEGTYPQLLQVGQDLIGLL
ncbi:hypothetical protein ADICEAN_03988 [Cesiribacter andamanensis AMV16]|uniref:Uncharacterized protein n=1 Tax=Cesiribacter andamanensis AMV16 TaxID=1279009 RepID=M7MWU4_9BACT|nr:hypothetical protein ADICEAN_03988 [Cesiribacter andamanensis AMV16]